LIATFVVLLTLQGKLEGDVKIVTLGDIFVTKLRGHHVELVANSTDWLIHVREAIEATTVKVYAKGSRLRARQIHGTSIQVDCTAVGRSPSDEDSAKELRTRPDDLDDEGALIDISSLYVTGSGSATLSVDSTAEKDNQSPPPPLPRSAVRVKSSHGPLRVATRGLSSSHLTINTKTGRVYPLVELGGINGQCEVSIQDSSGDQAADWASCVAHVDSLAAQSVSLLSADVGNVVVTMDRKVESDVRLLATLDEKLEQMGSALVEFDDIPNVLLALESSSSRAKDPEPGSWIHHNSNRLVPNNRIQVETKSWRT
jgi:hypothetical protein